MASLDEIAEERERIADFLAGLTAEQWQTPSSCSGWTIQTVTGHILGGPIKGVKGALPAMFKARGNIDKANSLVANELAAMGPEQLVAKLREHARHPFCPPGYGLDAPLTDVTLHGQDVSRPFDVDLGVPNERWRASLSTATSPRYSLFSSRSKVKRLRFVATDIDFSAGDGPAVQGTARDLAHVMWGRPDALGDLTGPGVATLRERFTQA